jgi:RNA polymerase sigma factor for flagellar operon FliA
MSEDHMATQPAPSYEQFKTRVLPALHPQVNPRKVRTQSKVRPAAPKDAAQELEKQRLLVALLPMVKRLAFQIREHLPARVELDDLISNGVLGLVDAVGKFDITKQVKLESYARHRIRGGILDGLRGADPASRDLRKKSRKIQQVYRELETKLGRPVIDEEIATALGISMEQWHWTLSEFQGVGFDFGGRSLSAGPTTKRMSAETTVLANDDDDPFEQCYQRERRAILSRALSHLRERDRQIITLYYQRELTMKQIGGRLNLDESRVSQLHSAALVRLKACADSMLASRHATAVERPACMSMAA